MNIEKNNITLTEDIYNEITETIYDYSIKNLSYIYNGNKEELFNFFKDILNKYINTINDLIYINFKELSDNEFYDLLCKVYNITLTEKDYLKILSKKNNKKYNKFTEINTYMTFLGTAQEGHGRDFSWWEQLYQIKYLIAVSEDTEIEYNTTLSKEEINKLIADKSIVIIGKRNKKIIHNLDINEPLEQFPITKLNFDYFNSLYNHMYGQIHKDENFQLAVALLRKKFTKKRILKDMKEYLEELLNNINIIQTDQMNIILSDSKSYKIPKLYNEWYDNSNEKKSINTLKKTLE